MRYINLRLLTYLLKYLLAYLLNLNRNQFE